MKELACHCGSQINFEDCCKRYINGTQKAATALTLMRSRYSAYATHNAESNQWINLEVLQTTENTVEFKAFYLDKMMQMQMHHENSTFKMEAGEWFYVDGKFY
jgi:SEC-C motif-containing protein